MHLIKCLIFHLKKKKKFFKSISNKDKEPNNKQMSKDYKPTIYTITLNIQYTYEKLPGPHQ